MAVDYDLVVVGNNAAARLAAIAARQQSARVALISVSPELMPHHLLLRQWTQMMADQVPHILGEWAEAMTMNLQASRSPAQLASLGIEQIDGVAQFSQKPQLQVQVQNRVLRSHRYLLALDADLPSPSIPGIRTEDWLTPADIIPNLDPAKKPLPNPLVVCGDGPVATILSQALARMGHSISLLSEHAHILPWEDAEAAFRVQAHLEADGVKIYTHCQIENVIRAPQPPWQVVTNQGVLTADTLIWAAESSSTTIDSNLVAVNLRHTPQGLWTDTKLQTSKSQIYACGSVLGGYTLPDITNYEASIAVKNSLSSHKQRVDYRALPWSIQTYPPLARVGLTETQALQEARPFQVLYQYFKDTEKGRLQDQTSGWCKLIVQNDGQILGAHVVGGAAAEIIHLLALAMKKHCPITDLTDFASFSSSFGSVIGQAAQQWSNK